MGSRFIKGEDLGARARSEGRPWPPPFPGGRPDPLAPPPPRPSPAVPAQGHGDPVPCQCQGRTVCPCIPCPGVATEEDFLCDSCRPYPVLAVNPLTGGVLDARDLAFRHCHHNTAPGGNGHASAHV